VGIRVEYQPVEAIQQLAYGAGQGKQQEYLDEIALKQQTLQDNREFELAMLRERERINQNQWKDKAKFELGAQQARDKRMHEYGLADMREQERIRDEQIQVQQDAAIAQEKQRRRDKYYELTPEANKESEDLKRTIKNIQSEVDDGFISAAEGNREIDRLTQRVEQIGQSDASYRRKDGSMTPEELQADFQDSIITDNDGNKWQKDNRTGNWEPIKVPADELRIKEEQQIAKEEKKQQEAMQKVVRTETENEVKKIESQAKLDLSFIRGELKSKNKEMSKIKSEISRNLAIQQSPGEKDKPAELKADYESLKQDKNRIAQELNELAEAEANALQTAMSARSIYQDRVNKPIETAHDYWKLNESVGNLQEQLDAPPVEVPPFDPGTARSTYNY